LIYVRIWQYFFETGLSVAIDRCHQILEAFQRRLNILNNIGGQHVGVGQVVKIGQGFVFEPEDVEVGFVAGYDAGVAELAPAACGVVGGAGFVAVKPIFRVVTVNKILQVCKLERVFLLQGTFRVFVYLSVSHVGDADK
jgi:hypothetical protein